MRAVIANLMLLTNITHWSVYLNLNNKIHDGKSTDSEIQEFNATVAHCH